MPARGRRGRRGPRSPSRRFRPEVDVDAVRQCVDALDLLGAEGRAVLRAQNLSLFLQIAAGVDDGTWLHHLHAGDYSGWIRDAIKDEDLADEVAAVERERDLDPEESRARIKEAVDRRYTGPASDSA